MRDVVLLTRNQLNRITPYCPLLQGIPRVVDVRVTSGSISVIRYGLQWEDAPKTYAPHESQCIRIRTPFVVT